MPNRGNFVFLAFISVEVEKGHLLKHFLIVQKAEIIYRGRMKKSIWLLRVVVLMLVATGCGGKHEIRLGEEVIASQDGREPESFHVETKYENPAVTGLINVHIQEMGEVRRLGTFTCCSRLELGSSQPSIFNPAHVNSC